MSAAYGWLVWICAGVDRRPVVGWCLHDSANAGTLAVLIG
jgi:hypothetical protein